MARAGLQYLRDELRALCEAGTADYTAGTVDYWSDEVLDNILDANAWIWCFQQLEGTPNTVLGGTVEYYDYYLPARNWEEGGTADPTIFMLQLGTGGTIASSDYTADYRNGLVSFNQNTRGTLYYVTGSSYDLNAAAADIWRRKAAHYASAYNFSTDNHSMSREVLMQHCLDMAALYEVRSDEAIGVSEMERDDTGG